MLNKEDRHLKLLKLLPKHKGKIAPAAMEAGFTKQTAYKRGNSLLKTALKKEARQTLAILENNTNVSTSSMKKTLAEKIGMSSEEVFERLKSIAIQERDLTSALKVLKPLSKDLGVDLGEEETQKVNVPILNVTVKEKATPIIPIEGSIEP